MYPSTIFLLIVIMVLSRLFPRYQFKGHMVQVYCLSLFRCKNIREIIMDEITIQGGYELVMQSLVKLAPQLTSVSFECTSHLQDIDVQVCLHIVLN